MKSLCIIFFIFSSFSFASEEVTAFWNNYDPHEFPLNVELVKEWETDKGKYFLVRYDLGKLVGTNKTYINKEIPYISSLLCRTIDEAVKGSEVIVIGHGLKEFRDAAKKYYKGRIIIDLCIHRAEQGSAAASVCCSRKACFA